MRLKKVDKISRAASKEVVLIYDPEPIISSLKSQILYLTKAYLEKAGVHAGGVNFCLSAFNPVSYGLK
jgi:hypothetical protein